MLSDNKQAPSFADLEEPLGDEPYVPDVPVVDAGFIGATSSEAPGPRYREQCDSCRGSGQFVSWSGRVVGDCFKCKGRGYREFRTSPEQRQHNRDAAARRKGKAAKAKSDQAVAFLKSRPDIREWLRREEGRGNGFAMSLQQGLFRYGKWTEKQLAAVERNLAREQRRAEVDTSEPDLSASDVAPVDLSEVPDGFYAPPHHDTRLKLRVRRGRRGTKWEGWIFVDDGAAYGQRQSYGRQRPGGHYSGQCVEQLRVVAQDPREASAAYGRLTSTCGVCGRPLEDEESVARGIGPVCAGKF